ncbi:MAG: GNAT family N-acetyltransferase [Candidatus Heimdallarchaeota archaeon]|nr:MAG: GNAT family N-acetyltransferase [Candidatus Heimdallarchaeota archaeon]
MQILELSLDKFHKIRSLFASTKHLRFTIEAVIAGNSPMQIWVDDKESPRSAFLWDQSHCYYFGGDASNNDFCNAVEYLLKNTVIPIAISMNREVFIIEYTDEEWEPVLKKILRDKTPFKVSRKFFVLDTLLTSQWRDILPSDFQIKRIDRGLLESDIKNLKAIINEINECWHSVDDFLANGFGFCLVHIRDKEKEVQGWCTGEYFSKEKCGIGIETFHGYRNRGFATAMASAFVEHSLSVNIQPHWNSSANNEASIRVAKKVGFRKIQDYYVLFGAFARIESFRGNYYYQRKDFKKSAQWYEKAAELNQKKWYNFYNAACSWALNGNIDFALDNLNKSLNSLENPSKRFINHMRTDSDLVNLYSTEEWKILLQRLVALEKSIKDNEEAKSSA